MRWEEILSKFGLKKINPTHVAAIETPQGYGGPMVIQFSKEEINKMLQDLVLGKYKQNPFSRTQDDNSPYLMFDAMEMRSSTPTTLTMSFTNKGTRITSDFAFSLCEGDTATITGITGGFRVNIE